MKEPFGMNWDQWVRMRRKRRRKMGWEIFVSSYLRTVSMFIFASGRLRLAFWTLATICTRWRRASSTNSDLRGSCPAKYFSVKSLINNTQVLSKYSRSFSIKMLARLVNVPSELRSYSDIKQLSSSVSMNYSGSFSHSSRS